MLEKPGNFVGLLDARASAGRLVAYDQPTPGWLCVAARLAAWAGSMTSIKPRKTEEDRRRGQRDPAGRRRLQPPGKRVNSAHSQDYLDHNATMRQPEVAMHWRGTYNSRS